MKPAILFIGGGPLQEPALRAARALGAEVLLVDRDPAPHCAPLATEHAVLDGGDVSGILCAAAAWSARYRIATCHGNNEFALPAAAACNELLDLPGPRPAAVLRCAHKPLMRELLARHGVAIPEGGALLGRPGADLPRPLPFVAKAAQGAGSVGVARIASRADWQRYGAALRGPTPLVVEAWVAGTHHDVQGVMVGGVLRGVAIADRQFGPKVLANAPDVEVSECLPVRGVYPSALAACGRAAIAELTERAARALGIDDSPVKADVVWTPDGPVLLELGPRFHGEIVSAFLVPAASGEEPIRDWFRYALGGVWWPTPAERAHTAVWTAILPERDRRVRAGARAEVAGRPDVRALVWRFADNTGQGAYADNREVRGLVVTANAGRERALREADRVLAAIQRGLCEPYTPAVVAPDVATQRFYESLYARSVERWPAEPVASFVERNLVLLREAPVLDLGCGSGRHLWLLEQRGVRGVGLDPARRGLAAAREWAGLRALVRGRAGRLPFADASFGGLIAWESLFYGDADDLVKCVGEALRVLRPGAPFLISFKSTQDYRVREYPEVLSRVHRIEGEQWMAFVDPEDVEALLAPHSESLAIETLARSHDNRSRVRVNLIATGVRRAKEET
jgi:biotin carboxylase/SAM-dependent methyltransferase